MQGSAAPVNGANSQPPGPIAMSAVGGISAPLTSPTGGSNAEFRRPLAPAMRIIRLHQVPEVSARRSDPIWHRDPGFVLLAGGQGDGQFALSSAELFDPAKNASPPRRR